MASSDLSPDQLIYVKDLALSMKNGQLRIRSKKLNKYVIPRLTTAHNYHTTSMPVYHFLCDMQHAEGRNMLLFDWSPELKKLFPFRPRVCYKHTILSFASWDVKNEELSLLFKITDKKTLFEDLNIWRTKRSIPRFTRLVDSDNKLFVDWDNYLSVQSLFSIIKKRSFFTFEEFLFDEEYAVVRKEEERYLNEFIVALKKTNI